MTIQTSEMKRTFKYGATRLPDPGKHLTPLEVRDLYSATYPELASAAIDGPEAKGSVMQYEFRRAVGTKG